MDHPQYFQDDSDDYQEEQRFHSSTPIKSLSHSNSSVIITHLNNAANQQRNSRRQPHNVDSAYHTCSRAELIAKIQEMELAHSQLALENEGLKFELKELRGLMQEKEVLQSKILSEMRKRLEFVTRSSFVISEKFCAFKRRYYQERNNDASWLDRAPEK